ncbi:MAG: rhomboid family intramembrane serine protease, partial [Phycisphaerae bacterium]
MYKPSSLQIVMHCPASAGTAALAVVVTSMWMTGWDISLLMMDENWWHGQWWRLVTSALPHVGIVHLVFNVYWLWAFGARLEQRLGSLRVAGMLVLLAAGSGAAEFAFSDGGVGLSGVGYGLFGFLWYLSRRPGYFCGDIDKQNTTLFVGLFFLCIILTLSDTMPVANIAHAAGAILGVMLAWTYSLAPEKRRFGTTAIAAVL